MATDIGLHQPADLVSKLVDRRHPVDGAIELDPDQDRGEPQERVLTIYINFGHCGSAPTCPRRMSHPAGQGIGRLGQGTPVHQALKL